MQHPGDDIPRLPAEDVVDHATEIPDVAHDDERHRPGADHEDVDGEPAESGDDLDPQLTD